MEGTRIRGRMADWADQRGFSAVDGLFAIMIFSTAVLGAAAASAAVNRVIAAGRDDADYWTTIHHRVERMLAAPYDSLQSGSTQSAGFPMSWSVSGVNPKQIVLVSQRHMASGELVQDTTVVYVADPTP